MHIDSALDNIHSQDESDSCVLTGPSSMDFSAYTSTVNNSELMSSKSNGAERTSFEFAKDEDTIWNTSCNAKRGLRRSSIGLDNKNSSQKSFSVQCKGSTFDAEHLDRTFKCTPPCNSKSSPASIPPSDFSFDNDSANSLELLLSTRSSDYLAVAEAADRLWSWPLTRAHVSIPVISPSTNVPTSSTMLVGFAQPRLCDADHVRYRVVFEAPKPAVEVELEAFSVGSGRPF